MFIVHHVISNIFPVFGISNGSIALLHTAVLCISLKYAIKQLHTGEDSLIKTISLAKTT